MSNGVNTMCVMQGEKFDIPESVSAAVTQNYCVPPAMNIQAALPAVTPEMGGMS